MKLTRLQNEGHVLHILKVTLSCLICFVITACSPSNPQRTRNEITGPQEERVTRATSILAKYGQLPGPLLDAHMAEDTHNNSDGMVPGPSESWLSGVILISSADVPKWREALSPEISPAPSPEFTSPIALPLGGPQQEHSKAVSFTRPRSSLAAPAVLLHSRHQLQPFTFRRRKYDSELS